LVSGASLINKTAFPRIALPISGVLASAVNYAVAIPLLIAFGMLFGVIPTLSLLLLPCAFVLLLLMAIGIGAFLSVLMPLFNDLQHLIEVIFTMWFFLTPVVYPITLVPERLIPLYELNPMVGIIGLVHFVFLGQPLPLRSLFVAAGGVVGVLILGLWVFKRMAIRCTEV
jgi:ABC-type polysaccharide/polyol phosphate export permease